MNAYKTSGILGGMGPMATYDLAMKILDHTRAASDQEHIPVIIDCNTRISDRTEAILHGGADPLPEMLRSARRLEAAGADFLIMPCNTAHYYYDQICAEIGIPMLHMPRETASRLRERGVKRAAVLATDGTCQSGIYGKALEEAGIEAVYPSAENQALIMSLIYDHVKADRWDFSDVDIDSVIEEMRELGAEILILGCTELPIAFSLIGEVDLPTIDPTDVLARAAIEAAGGVLNN